MRKYNSFILVILLMASAILFLIFQKNNSNTSKESDGGNPEKGLVEKKSVEIPFDMPAIPNINFPDRICTLTDYAAIGDGKFLNTENFQSAITDCAKQGGGTVIVPPGIWLTGPIRLESNINLHLEEGARILFSDTFSDYLPPVLTRFEGMELYNYAPFISAKDCSNIAITGKGELDGQGDAWLTWNDIMQNSNSDVSLKKVATNKLYEMSIRNIPVEKRVFGTEKDAIQPAFIEFLNCRDILVEEIEILNSPGWTLHPIYSENIIIRNIYINTSKRNTDGVVIDSSRNVIVENSSLNTGDDSVVIKSGKDHDGWRINKPSENIIIHDIVIEDGNSGIAIGSEMSGDVRNVFIYNVDIQVADFGIRFKSMRGRGGVVENVWIDNVFMRRMNFGAIELDTKYGTPIVGYDESKLPVFRNIEIKNVECRRTKDAIRLSGLSESPLRNITLENISILSSRGVTIENIEEKHLKNVSVTVKGKPISIE
jgi:polygalacturonase